MSDMLRELYQEVIIDHNRNPRHFGELKVATHHADGVNPLCGDQLQVELLIHDDQTIADIKFKGKGCAISIASGSLMSELLLGKTIQEAEKLFQQFHELVTNDGELDISLGKLAVLAGVKQYPARVKCATLAWHTLHAALQHDNEAVSTE